MTIMTENTIKKMESYYYWSGYKLKYPFPNDLRSALLDTYGEEPYPYSWSEEDIYRGSRRIILNYFEAH